MRTQVKIKPAAAQPMSSAQGGFLQRKCVSAHLANTCGEWAEDREKELQRAPMPNSSRSSQHGSGESGSADALPVVQEVLRSSGQPLDAETRAFMEPRFGYNFGDVRIHTNTRAAESARAVNAMAYTVGRHVVFGAGQYAPRTSVGAGLIAHELTHVVQQGAHVTPELSELGMAQPVDATEREADNVALAVTSGQSLPHVSDRAVTLARQPAAKAAHKPKPPPPVALISPVVFGGTLNRVAPTKTATVGIVVVGLPPGSSVKVDIEGTGGANGSASVTAGDTLAGSGTATIRGDTQTAPGKAGNLKVRAKVGKNVIGRSDGFTVAAYPINYTDTFLSDIDDGTLLGMNVQDGWSSDGSGAIAELDEVEISERVDMQSRDNPPFTIPGATSATGGTSGYLPANSLTTDKFQMAKASIDTTGLVAGAWRRVQGQLCLFKCKRTGVTDVVMPASGYKIIQQVFNFMLPPFPPEWKHLTIHEPADITVEGRAATAGGGTAVSPLHKL